MYLTHKRIEKHIRKSFGKLIFPFFKVIYLLYLTDRFIGSIRHYITLKNVEQSYKLIKLHFKTIINFLNKDSYINFNRTSDSVNLFSDFSSNCGRRILPVTANSIDWFIVAEQIEVNMQSVCNTLFNIVF